MLEPTQDFSAADDERRDEQDTLLSRLFGVRRSDGVTIDGDRAAARVPSAGAPSAPGQRAMQIGHAGPAGHTGHAGHTGPAGHTGRAGPTGRSVGDGDALRDEITDRVSGGFRDLSRLLVAIKETLQNRDGQVQQTLQALPGYLQQVPKIQRAQIECMAQISKQLEHMGTGTRDVLARLDAVPDLLRNLALHQQEQAKFLEELQARTAGALDVQSSAIREGLETSRQQAETQLQMIRSIAGTQEDVFATFQNTQNRALNVFHRAQQQANSQHTETQKVLSRQVEMLVQKVHAAQSRVFWLSIGFAVLLAAGLVAALLLK